MISALSYSLTSYSFFKLRTTFASPTNSIEQYNSTSIMQH